jgi:uncharacterized protein (TIGR02246 family)
VRRCRELTREAMIVLLAVMSVLVSASCRRRCGGETQGSSGYQAGMGSATTRVDRAADEAAVRQVEAAYDRAWDAGDLASLLRLCDADVVVIDPSGRTSVGREEMERMLSSLFDGAGKGSTHSSDIVGVHFVTADVALADGEATIEGFALSPGDGQALRHRFTDVLVKRSEGWRIAQVRAYVFMHLPGL